MEESPTFGRLVFGRAISETAKFFGYTSRDIVLAVIALTLGLASAYVFVGKADTVKEVAFMIAFTFAPGGIILFAVFLWHLWLAPAALAYEAIRASNRASPVAGSAKTTPREKAVNWGIWKQRSTYELPEFAAILAKTDPIVISSSSDKSGFLSLIQEDAMSGKLTVQRGNYAEPSYNPDLYPEYFIVQKATAVKWAESKGFDVSHIK